MKIFFETKNFDPGKNFFEITELKGIGHPDTLCDSIGAKLGIEYSKFWLKEIGGELHNIPHYNLDKLLLGGGESSKKWKGGSITKPVDVIIGGNVTKKVGKTELDLQNFCEKHVKKVLQKNAGQKFEYKVITNHLSKGSSALVKNYQDNKEISLANDTSFGTGHYPYTKLEETVKAVQNYLLQKKLTKKWIGTDIKIMGRRTKDENFITVALATIDEHISDDEDYLDKMHGIRRELMQKFDINSLNLNMADKPHLGKQEDNYYLTVSGTSAENADPGQIGRGNRTNGLISPFRYQTLEATAGKNLTRHVGGFYNIWAQQISKKLHEKLGLNSQVVIVSELGRPITECMVSVVTSQKITDPKKVEDLAKEVMDNHEKNVYNILENKIEYYPFNYLKNV